MPYLVPSLDLQLVFVLRHARKNVDPFLQDLVALGDDPLAHIGRGIVLPVAQVGAAEALSSFEPLAGSHNNRSCRGISGSTSRPARKPSNRRRSASSSAGC